MKRLKTPGRLFSYAIRTIVACISIFLLIWAAVPLVSGIFNAGIAASVIVLVPVIFLCVFWKLAILVFSRMWKWFAGRIIIIAAGALSAVVLVMFITASMLMLYSAAKPPAEGGTVIVLGCGLYGDVPSLMLADRLKAAVRYLEDNPDSVCVLSGGQGADEPCTEADAMYRYMINRWDIDPARLYKEELSTSTQENISFSMEIIKREGMSEHVVIATQEFHQYRAGQMAKKAGALSVGAATCRTPLYLLECYWVREFAAVGHLWLLG